MKVISILHRLSGLCLTLGTSLVHAQEETKYHPSERLLLDLVMRDTISHSVCYLPEAYFFGSKDRHLGFFNLLKAGRRNHFLRPGSGQVLEVISVKGETRLKRIDSTHHSGDNFRMVTLERKDTLYAIGGYGFWEPKEHFTYFKPDKGVWEFLPIRNPMPVQHWYQQYDPGQDALFFLGGATREEAARNRQNPYQDSVRRFDFRTRTWTTLGSLHPDFAELTRRWSVHAPRELNYTPFGILDLTGPPVVVDLPNNRVFLLKPYIVDRLTQFASRFPSRMLQTTFMNIYLQDTLHLITAIKDSVLHAKFRITKDDIDQSSTRQLYVPTKTPQLGSSTLWLMIVLLTLTSMAAVLMFWRRQKRNKISLHKPSEPKSVDTALTGIENLQASTTNGHPGMESAMERFFHSLPIAERELLNEMMSLARRGSTIDVEEMNRMLGVSRKDEAIRKVRRSRAIKTINDAFSICLNQTDDLILRSRQLDDKRMFSYRLNQEHLSVLTGSS